MKMKQILAMVLCMVLVACVSVAVTLAFLTDTEEAINTFTVGQVKIMLDETDVDENGVEDGDTRVQQNAYKLMPGHTYIKDPMVTIEANSEKAFVRMLVTVNELADLKTVFPNDVENGVFMLQNFVQGWDRSLWEIYGVTEDQAANTATYEFRYFETVGAGAAAVKLDPLFDSFTMPGTLDNEDIIKLSDDPATETVEPSLQINVVAEAIQADGFNGNADAAWTAFTAQGK